MKKVFSSALFWVVAAFATLVFGNPFLADAQQQQRKVVPQIWGTQGNAWSAAAVGIAGTSNVVETTYTPTCSVFGNSGSASTITVQFSTDGTTFYSSTHNTGAVTGDFGLSFVFGARYVRLISSAASTITATVQCKG